MARRSFRCKTVSKAPATSDNVMAAMLHMIQAGGQSTRERFCQSFVETVKSLLPFDEACVSLVDERGQAFESTTIVPAEGMCIRSMSRSLPKGSSVATILSRQETQAQQDVPLEDRRCPGRVIVKAGFREVLQVPLTVNSQPVGFFELRSRRANVYGSREKWLLEQLCAVFAHLIGDLRVVALENTSRAEADKQARARVRFLDMLAHELKTPLTPVVTCAHILANSLPSEAGSYEERCIRSIIAGAERLRARIEEMLDLARYEMGPLVLDCKKVNLVPLIRKVAAQFELHCEGHQSVALGLQERLPLVRADGGRLWQVVATLLNNAGSRTPKSANIQLRAFANDRDLIVEVEDAGPCLSAADIERLFEYPWNNEVDRRRLPSVSLGLVDCKRFVEAHGGRIWGRSEPGTGNIFGFALPLAGRTFDSIVENRPTPVSSNNGGCINSCGVD